MGEDVPLACFWFAVEDWKKKQKLKFLGVPPYVAHGLHDKENESFRFLVMPRLGDDIHNLWLKAKKRFRRATVAKIAIQMVCVALLLVGVPLNF